MPSQSRRGFSLMLAADPHTSHRQTDLVVLSSARMQRLLFSVAVEIPGMAREPVSSQCRSGHELGSSKLPPNHPFCLAPSLSSCSSSSASPCSGAIPTRPASECCCEEFRTTTPAHRHWLILQYIGNKPFFVACFRNGRFEKRDKLMMSGAIFWTRH